VDQPGSTPMTPGLYRELLRQKLDAMIQADPRGARQVMEMSRDNAPGLWEIAQQNPIQDWASVLMRSDQMTTLLAPVTMNGFLLAKTPQLIHEILELLA
jgi:hypothetical protein